MSIDLLPTIAALTGAALPSDRVIDGKNIRDVMQGGGDTPHEHLFFFNGNDVAAVRDARFKLVLNAYYKSFYVPFEQFGGMLLFDLENDPQERFSFVRENPDSVADLKAAVNQMRLDVADFVIEPVIPLAPRPADTPVGPQLTTP